MNTILGNTPSPFELVCDGAMRSSKLGEDRAHFPSHQTTAAALSSSNFCFGQMLVADWSISSTPRCLLASLDPVTDRA